MWEIAFKIIWYLKILNKSITRNLSEKMDLKKPQMHISIKRFILLASKTKRTFFCQHPITYINKLYTILHSEAKQFGDESIS